MKKSFERTDQYNDIINMPHHVSKKRELLSMKNRAAQFAPFAALTGFSGEVEKTARENEEKYET